MRNLDETTITQAVLATHRDASDARLSEVMTSLVQHLHAFARDIQLSEQEWRNAVAFLQQAATVSTSQHSEVALLSHALGLTTLVLAQNRKRPAGCTEAAAIEGRPALQAQMCDLGADITPGQAGPKGWVHGTVRDSHARPVPYATLQVSASGFSDAGPALLQADANGHFHFRTSLPRSQHIVAEGPVDWLLAALDRPTWRPAHLEFVIDAAGFRPLATLVFREGDPHLATDALFGVRASLVAEWQPHPAGTAPDGTPSLEPFHTLSFDFVLAPG